MAIQIKKKVMKSKKVGGGKEIKPYKKKFSSKFKSKLSNWTGLRKSTSKKAIRPQWILPPKSLRSRFSRMTGLRQVAKNNIIRAKIPQANLPKVSQKRLRNFNNNYTLKPEGTDSFMNVRRAFLKNKQVTDRNPQPIYSTVKKDKDIIQNPPLSSQSVEQIKWNPFENNLQSPQPPKLPERKNKATTSFGQRALTAQEESLGYITIKPENAYNPFYAINAPDKVLPLQPTLTNSNSNIRPAIVLPGQPPKPSPYNKNANNIRQSRLEAHKAVMNLHKNKELGYQGIPEMHMSVLQSILEKQKKNKKLSNEQINFLKKAENLHNAEVQKINNKRIAQIEENYRKFILAKH